MTTRRNRMLGWMAVSLLAVASPALADHHENKGKPDAAAHAKQGKTELTPEARAKRADAHQRMADCLRSTRPMAECHAEMKKSCEGMHGKAGCSMGHHGGADKAHGVHGAPTDMEKVKPKAK